MHDFDFKFANKPESEKIDIKANNSEENNRDRTPKLQKLVTIKLPNLVNLARILFILHIFLDNSDTDLSICLPFHHIPQSRISVTIIPNFELILTIFQYCHSCRENLRSLILKNGGVGQVDICKQICLLKR